MGNRIRGVTLVTAFLLGLTTNGIASASPLSFKKGFNLVAFTVEFDPPMSSHTLGGVLGSELVSIGRMLVATQTIEETRFQNAVPSGPDFPIAPGEGYLVQMAADVTVDAPTGATAGDGNVDLALGNNLIGFLPVSHRLSAFQVLALVTDDPVRASLSHFDRRRGRFETATRSGDTYAGVDFGITPVEGYLFASAQAQPGLSLPPLVFVRSSESYGLIADTFPAGGGHATSARFRLFDSFGQPTMQGTSFRLRAGFLAACCADLP